MIAHNPKTKLPPVGETVLLLHWYDDEPDREPLCETGYLYEDGIIYWHNRLWNTDELEVHGWAELPVLPEERP